MKSHFIGTDRQIYNYIINYVLMFSSLLDLEERGSQLTQKSKQQYGRLVAILELCNFLLICLT